MLFKYWFNIEDSINNITLPKEVISHINKKKNKEFKEVSKKAWSFLINVLIKKFNIDFSHERIKFSFNGKPYLESNKIYFSISHSLNIIAIAISDKHVGIDVEKTIPNNLCDLLSKRILNQKQYNEYEKQKDKASYITKIWTQKEAYVKCNDLSMLNIDKLNSINLNNKNTKLIKDSHNNKYFLSWCEK